MTTEFTNIAQTAKSTKSVSFGVSSLPCDRDKFHGSQKPQTALKIIVKPSQASGQALAGSGVLVFEGELLEIPVWN